MRIALICPYDLDRPGGVQNHVRELAAGLRARGHDVETFGPGRTGRLGPSITVNVNGSQAPIGIAPTVASRLTRALNVFAPDVVHVHEPVVPLVGWVATKRRDMSVTVATCHAYSDTSRLLRPAQLAGRRIVRHIDRLIAVSDAAVAFHQRVLDVSPAAFHVIGNGIDLDGFTRSEPRATTDVTAAPRLVFLGRLERRKGVDTLIDAFHTFTAAFPHAELAIVGDGPERAALTRQLPAHLAGQVTFTGRVSDTKRQQMLAWADLAVAPARGGESFGIVLLEALASGCALVATDIPGYRSVVRRHTDGWLVPPEDPAALAYALLEAVTNHPVRHERLANGYARVAMFAWPAISEAVEAVYRDARTARGATRNR